MNHKKIKTKCENPEHKKPCSENATCEYCGLSTCSPDYAYHLCIIPHTKETDHEPRHTENPHYR